MRVFLLLILLIIPWNAYATCDSNYSSDRDGCIQAAGCYWTGVACAKCPATTTSQGGGRYCPRNGECPDNSYSSLGSGICECPAPFTSSFSGSTEIRDCFAEIECNDSIHTEVRAGVAYTTDAEFFLAPIANEGFWDFDDQAYHQWPANNPDLFYNQFHLETTGSGANVEFACESNTTTCDNFSTTNEQCELLSDYNATWVNDENGGYWNVSLCKCSTNSATISDKNCTGVQTLSAIEDQTGVTHVGGDAIEFNSNPDSYYCTSCIADYDSHVYYADTEATGCEKDLSQGHVCACAELTTKGWFRTGNCDPNQNWGQQSDICVIQACLLPGQTTDSIGPTGPNSCKYGANTKICDSSGGCVSLPAGGGTWTAIIP